MTPSPLFPPLSPHSGVTDTPHVDAPLSTPLRPFRVLHYLGGKGRLLGPIHTSMSAIARPGSRVCDLFAGSGAVALCLSRDWEVIATDIQEYSRVISNGILNRPQDAVATGQALRGKAARSSLRHSLRSALGSLLSYERRCMRDALGGHVHPLCDVAQHGSLQAIGLGFDIPSPNLNQELGHAWNRLCAAALHKGPAAVVSRHFGGAYFSWHQAVDLDALLACVHRLKHDVRDHLLTAVLATASDIVNTVGKQFAQPIRPRDGNGRPKWHLVRKILTDRSMSVFDTFSAWVQKLSDLDPPARRAHRAMRADYCEVLSNPAIHFDAVYADPPYTRDHYSRYYHVLETMALRDDPQVSTTLIRSGGAPRPSRGFYRTDRHQSPFCIKLKAPEAFDRLFEGTALRHVPLVLSYSPYKAGNRPRLLTIDQLLSLASRHYRHVDCHAVDGTVHNKLNLSARNAKADYSAEVIVTCKP